MRGQFPSSHADRIAKILYNLLCLLETNYYYPPTHDPHAISIYYLHMRVQGYRNNNLLYYCPRYRIIRVMILWRSTGKPSVPDIITVVYIATVVYSEGLEKCIGTMTVRRYDEGVINI